MSFSYPEVKMPKGQGDTATDNNWDKRCSSYEILAENVKHPKGKKPLQLKSLLNF